LGEAKQVLTRKPLLLTLHDQEKDTNKERRATKKKTQKSYTYRKNSLKTLGEGARNDVRVRCMVRVVDILLREETGTRRGVPTMIEGAVGTTSGGKKA